MGTSPVQNRWRSNIPPAATSTVSSSTVTEPHLTVGLPIVTYPTLNHYTTSEKVAYGIYLIPACFLSSPPDVRVQTRAKMAYHGIHEYQ